MGKCINLDTSACIWWAILVLTVPLPWLVALTSAALFHELGHIFTVWVFGGSITEIQLFSFGAWMQASPMSAGKRILSTLTGPLFSFLLLLSFRIFPRVALCGLIQGIVNLLPLPWLDGGRVVKTVKDEKWESVSN